jgi:hypothetical protein
MNAFAVGEIVGLLAVHLLISVVVLFVNRQRRTNPTPYLAAGGICALLTWLSKNENDWRPVEAIALYTALLALLWRYKLETNAQPSVLGRLNAVAHSGLLVSAIATMGTDGNLLAWFGCFLMAGSALAKWVWMARKP